MEYSCDCGSDEGDTMLCGDSKIVKARKSHVCIECNDLINIGDKYERTAGIWNDGPATYYTCLTCVKIRDDFCSCGFIFGGLREALWECLEVEP